MQIIYIIYDLLDGEWIVPLKKEKTKKSRKRSVYGTFGTLRGTRTLDLLVRSQSLYPTELAAHTSINIKLLANYTYFDLAFRSQSLYPTELAARVSKNIKMLAVCTQIDLAFRSQTLYPTELPAQIFKAHCFCALLL